MYLFVTSCVLASNPFHSRPRALDTRFLHHVRQAFDRAPSHEVGSPDNAAARKVVTQISMVPERKGGYEAENAQDAAL